MNTKSKRHLNRSQSVTRAPRHYSHLIEDDGLVKAGLWIVGGLAAFLVFCFLLVMV